MSRSCPWFLLLLVVGCRLGTGGDLGASKLLDDVVSTKPPQLPAPGGTNELAPWGGADSTQWRAEAIVANASSAELNRAWSEADVADVIVAMPLRLFPSDFFPYGDGQSNTNTSFEGWKTKRPPLLATLIRYVDGATKVVFRFDREWKAQQQGYDQVEVRYRAQDGTQGQVTLTGQIEDGELVAIWTDPPASLGWSGTTGKGVALVRPAPGFSDMFPVSFEIPVRRVAPMMASVRTQLGQNKPQDFKDFLERTLVPDRQKLKLTEDDKALLRDIKSLDPASITFPPGSPDRAAREALLAEIKERIEELVNLHKIDNPGISDARLQALRM